MRAKYVQGFLAFFFFIGFNVSVSAQDASRVYIEPMGWSIGTNFGMSDMWGNVGTLSVVDHYTNSKAFDKPCFLGGMFARYTIHPCLAFRGQLNIGALYSTDKWNYDKAKVANSQANDAYQRYVRDQNALDYMAEGLLIAEFSPFRVNPESKMAHRRGQPFLGAGIGGLYFVPYASVGNTSTFVQTYNLHLEGQGWGAGYPQNYSLWQPCFPVVLGYKWDLGMHFNLGVEWMYRFTLTNYLDGVANNYVEPTEFAKHLSAHDAQVALMIEDKTIFMTTPITPAVPGSTRGTPTTYDSYSTLTVTFYYKVKNRRREWWH